jgi:hypothetical protein
MMSEANKQLVRRHFDILNDAPADACHEIVPAEYVEQSTGHTEAGHTKEDIMYAQVMLLDGPRTPELVAADDRAGRERIMPLVSTHPQISAAHPPTRRPGIAQHRRCCVWLGWLAVIVRSGPGP